MTRASTSIMGEHIGIILNHAYGLDFSPVGIRLIQASLSQTSA
jgi:hypothetical protein